MALWVMSGMLTEVKIHQLVDERSFEINMQIFQVSVCLKKKAEKKKKMSAA